MRDLYHDELDGIGESLVTMTHMVTTAMERASRALLECDLGLAEQVISDDAAVDALRTDLEERTFGLLVRQQPVAGDLRLLVTGLHINSDLERMGDLALHVAKLTRLRYPDTAVPAELREVIEAMTEAAMSQVAKLALLLDGREVGLAREIELGDDSMDALHRRLYSLLLTPAWPYGTEAAIDMTLLGRYFERFADHAVSVARRVVFVVTGERPIRVQPSPG